MQGVVYRPQIRIDLLAHVAGQEAQPLAGLDGRPREDQALDDALLEQRDGMADREPGLAGAGGSFREDQLIALERAQIEILRALRARTSPRLRVMI